jgi:hypothetical protein
MTDYTPNIAGSKRVIRTPYGREDDALGPLKLLPGTWANIRPEHRVEVDNTKDPFEGEGTREGQGKSPFDGRGWNLIALPFAEEGQFRNYRLLENQYNEVLRFDKVDDAVPNRGISDERPAENTDQEVAALDYQQQIKQIVAKDVSESGIAGDQMLPIHHEPGFFLHMKKQTVNGFNIARLATVPHGNSATAIGISREFDGRPNIPNLSGFPEGVTADDITEAVDAATAPNSYLFPYNIFTKNPFTGVVQVPNFPGFSPSNANLLLQGGVPVNVARTTELKMETDVLEAGIVNIPFIERQADATLMRSTFWIMELDQIDEKTGKPKLILAYSQFIFLDFFPRRDGVPGLIRWPHISINMMEKIEEP